MSKLRLPKKYIVINYEDIPKTNFPLNEPFNLIVFKETVKCDFVVHLKENTEKLLVLGSGLTPRDKVPKMNPYYNRVSWNFKYSTIFFNDPTSYVNEDIYGAWGFGTKETWYIEILADIIKCIADNLYQYPYEDQYKNIIFTGSSQGGYMAFMLSVLVKNSSSICDIPQTDIFEKYESSKNLPFYIYKKSILNSIIKSEEINELYENYGYRISFIELMKKEKYIPNAYLCLDCSENIDFETQYIPFFKKLNQLPFKNESTNNIHIRIDGKNTGHGNMSKEKLMKTIDNVSSIINSQYIENISYKHTIKYNIAENNVKENGIIRFYGLGEYDLKNLWIICKDKKICVNTLKKGFSKRLGEYIDLPAKLLCVGIHNIQLKYKDKYSKFSKVFIKDEYNQLDYNIWSGTDYKVNFDKIFAGLGQDIESSTEWSYHGERSLKITKIGKTFMWTDFPISTNFIKDDIIEASATVKSNANASMFLVYKYADGTQSFSKEYKITKGDIENISIKDKIPETNVNVHLRFWIKGDIGENIFVDNLKVILKKKNIAIYGSCGTKDPFTSLFNKHYKKNYVAVINDQRHSFISTMQKKDYINDSLLEINPPSSGNKFTTKCLIEDFNKQFIDLMLDNDIDYLVFDVFFEVDVGVLKYDNDKIITNAHGIRNTEFYKKIKNKKVLNMIDNTNEFFTLWKEYCDKFFDFLKSSCPNTKIVLAEIRAVDKILNENGSISVDSNFSLKSEIYNPLIIKLENYIKTNYNINVIKFDEKTVCIENHVWGKYFIHYQNEYYTNFLKKFDKIVDEDSKI